MNKIESEEKSAALEEAPLFRGRNLILTDYSVLMSTAPLAIHSNLRRLEMLKLRSLVFSAKGAKAMNWYVRKWKRCTTFAKSRNQNHLQQAPTLL